MSPAARETLAWTIVVLIAGALLWLTAWPRAVTVQPPRPALALQWRAGTAQQYRCEIDATVHLAGRGADHSAPMTQQVRGVLAVQHLAQETDGALVGMRLSPVELRVGGAVDEVGSRALAAPFRVRFAADGSMNGFAFPQAVDAAHAALLEELVRTFQFVVRDEPSWRTRETHGTGTYEARYDRIGAAELRRTKERYLEPDGTQPSPSLRVLAATATATIDPGAAWLAHIEVDERVVRTDESGLTIEVATRAALHLLPGGAGPVAQAAEAWDVVAAEAAATARAAVAAGPVLTDRPTDDLLAELDTIVADLEHLSEGRTPAIHRLRDLLRADDRVAALLLAMLRERELGDRTRADLFLAYELGGTVASQASLCEVAADAAWSRADRTRALIALGGIADPDAATVTALWRATRDRSSAGAAEHANTATLALGVLGSRLAGTEAGAAAYADVRDGLLSAAWGAQDDGERAVFVTALGNLGDRALVPEVTPFLDDRAVDVRRAAAKALGRLGTEAVSTELAQRLRGETSSRVRRSLAAALDHCGTPSPAAMAAVRAAVAGEPDEATRLDLARLLGRHLRTAPENRAVLQGLLVTERSTRVRQVIEEAVRADATLRGD